MNFVERFLEAATAGELRAPYCPRCNEVVWYPRSACPRCLETPLEERLLSGHGVLVSAAVVHRTQNEALQGETPFPIGLVRLDEGPTMVARLEGEPSLGSALVAEFRQIGGKTLPVFRAV